MIPKWFLTLCTALLLATANQSPAAGQAPQPLPSDTKPIQVFLTASGKNAPSELPPQADLSVFIDKQPAQILSLSPAREDKLLFALLIDISTSEAREADPIRKAAWQIFESLSSEGNQGYLVFFSHEVIRSNVPLQPASARTDLDQVKFGGGTALFDAIGTTCRKALRRSANPDAPRRAILLLSDGEDNSSRYTLKEAEEAAEVEGVAIFSLSKAGSPSGEQKLEKAGQDTGGLSIVADELGSGVAPLLAAVHGQWKLTLRPQQAPDQKLHSLEIKISQKSVRISAPARIPLQ
jgi:hypothetical protein